MKKKNNNNNLKNEIVIVVIMCVGKVKLNHYNTIRICDVVCFYVGTVPFKYIISNSYRILANFNDGKLFRFSILLYIPIVRNEITV